MSGLWRYDPKLKGGKYLVIRRDGTLPKWPYIVLGAADPAASNALLAYAEMAQKLGYDPKYITDVRKLADEFSRYLRTHMPGEPDVKWEKSSDDDCEFVIKLLENMNSA